MGVGGPGGGLAGWCGPPPCTGRCLPKCPLAVARAVGHLPAPAVALCAEPPRALACTTRHPAPLQARIVPLHHLPCPAAPPPPRCAEMFKPFGTEVTQRMMCVTGVQGQAGGGGGRFKKRLAHSSQTSHVNHVHLPVTLSHPAKCYGTCSYGGSAPPSFLAPASHLHDHPAPWLTACTPSAPRPHLCRGLRRPSGVAEGGRRGGPQHARAGGAGEAPGCGRTGGAG